MSKEMREPKGAPAGKPMNGPAGKPGAGRGAAGPPHGPWRKSAAAYRPRPEE